MTTPGGTASRSNKSKSRCDQEASRLPIELLLKIADQLQVDGCNKTLTSLGSTNKALNERIVPMQYQLIKLFSVKAIRAFFSHFTVSSLRISEGAFLPIDLETQYGYRQQYLRNLMNHMELKIPVHDDPNEYNWIQGVKAALDLDCKNSTTTSPKFDATHKIVLSTLYVEVKDLEPALEYLFLPYLHTDLIAQSSFQLRHILFCLLHPKDYNVCSTAPKLMSPSTISERNYWSTYTQIKPLELQSVYKSDVCERAFWASPRVHILDGAAAH